MTLRLDPLAMKPTDTRWSYRAGFSALPLDLLFVVVFLLVADALVSTVVTWPFLRILVGLPVLFFLPGYVLLAALFPAAAEEGTERDSYEHAYEVGSIPFPTRIALSFGLSVALIPVYSILLALSPVGFGASSILALLTVHVLLGAVIGAARRMRLPHGERFRVPVGRWRDELREFVSGGPGPLGTIINVFLVVAIVLAASGLAYAVFDPPAEAEYTDFLLLTRGEDDELVASGYPSNFTRGTGQELVVGIANHRDRATDYTVVVELQRIRGEGESFQIVERSELARYQATVDRDETWYRPHDVAPDLVGEDLRLVYYLYRGTAPAEPSMDTADDHLHVWIDVSLESGPESAVASA